MYDQLKQTLSAYFRHEPVVRAYLFGSYARNTQDDESDIDLLVELDYARGADFYTFLRMQRDLQLLLKKPVDLVSANGLSLHIKPIIDREKVLLYENTTGQPSPITSYS